MGFLSDPNPFLCSPFCKAGTMTLKISFPLCKQIPVCQKGLQKEFKRQEEDIEEYKEYIEERDNMDEEETDGIENKMKQRNSINTQNMVL